MTVAKLTASTADNLKMYRSCDLLKIKANSYWWALFHFEWKLCYRTTISVCFFFSPIKKHKYHSQGIKFDTNIFVRTPHKASETYLLSVSRHPNPHVLRSKAAINLIILSNSQSHPSVFQWSAADKMDPQTSHTCKESFFK